MLVVRREQMQALEGARLDAFEQRVRQNVLARSAEDGRTMSMDRLPGQLRAVLRQGREYFDREQDIVRFVEIVLLNPGGWETEQPPDGAHRLLSGRALSPERRLKNLEFWANGRQKGDVFGRQRIRQ